LIPTPSGLVFGVSDDSKSLVLAQSVVVAERRRVRLHFRRPRLNVVVFVVLPPCPTGQPVTRAILPLRVPE